jgi:hypothetical protein
MRDDTKIREEFEHARERAVALTDAYFAAGSADDPRREVLWNDVASETERARSLLERWLRVSEPATEMTAAEEPALVLV